VVRLLVPHRWLALHQPTGGWSVLHQAAFHGVGKGLLRRLRELGACAALRTAKGQTARAVAEQYHPDAGLAAAFDEIFGGDAGGGAGGEPGLGEGDMVALSRVGAPAAVGAVTQLHGDGQLTIRTGAGEEVRVYVSR
jgi:hypothetical protein